MQMAGMNFQTRSRHF
ncbi:DUF6783 domain-containing protein [uncultured Robinsoniella sp.]